MKTYLDDYFEQFPDAPKIDGKFPLNKNDGKCLCVKQFYPHVDCILGDHADCRSCWCSQIKCDCYDNFKDVLNNGKNIKMKNIAGCTEDESWTLDDCETKCPKYYGCYSVALANDILKEYEDEVIKE